MNCGFSSVMVMIVELASGFLQWYENSSSSVMS